jgi:5-methylcytosine-specific restriction endonuclease McrA
MPNENRKDHTLFKNATKKGKPMALKMLKPRLKTLNTDRVPVLKSNPDSWRNSTQTTSERGYGWAWQKARAGHLRDSPLCVMCRAEGRVVVATVVDHSIPHRGDMVLFWKSEHWQSLCASHHSSEAQRRDNASR